MKAEQLRKAILQMAIQGKLVPQDPNDEPASVLLERIKNEKDKLIKEGKIKKDKIDSYIFKGDDNRYYEKIGKETVDITDDLPFEIPDSWMWVRLKSILTISTGDKDANQGNNSGIYDFYTCALEPIKSNTYSFDGDCLILPGNGANVGVVIRHKGKFEAYQRTYVLKAISNSISLSFIQKHMNYNWKEYNADKLFGSAIPYIKYGNLSEYLFAVPPFIEQKRIVKIIEQFEPLLSEYEKLEQDSTKLDSEIYDKLKKSILQYAIQGKLVPQDPNDEPASVLLERIRAEKKVKLGKKYVESYIYKGDDNCYYEKVGSIATNISNEIPFEIPNSWFFARLGSIGEWGAGATPTRTNYEYYNNGTIPWLKTGELNNSIVYDSEEKITDMALKKCSLRYNHIGDVLIAMYGATIGKLAIAGVNLTTNQACCACTPNSGVYNKFLFYVLMANKENIIKMGLGGAQPNISKEKIINFIIPIPPTKEQNRLVIKLQNLLNIIK